MQDKISVQAYRQTVACLEERWRELLLNLLPEQQGAVTEIRFRSQRPVALHFPGRTAFLAEGGTLCERPTHAAVIPSQIYHPAYGKQGRNLRTGCGGEWKAAECAEYHLG